MNRYGYMISEEPAESKPLFAKAIVKKKRSIKSKKSIKLNPISDGQVDRFTMTSVRKKVLSTPPRKVPSPRIRKRLGGERSCYQCGFHIEDTTNEFQVLCNRCDSEIRRRERGIDDDMPITIAILFAIACLSFSLTWMVMH